MAKKAISRYSSDNMLKNVPEDSELLSSIDPDIAKLLVKMIAQLSEHSYRRGLSYGAVVFNATADENKAVDNWRFSTSIDSSPAFGGLGFSMTAEERISGAVNNLKALGLKC